MMSIRAGLLDISQSWATLGRKCNVLAESQRVRGGGGRARGERGEGGKGSDGGREGEGKEREREGRE